MNAIPSRRRLLGYLLYEILVDFAIFLIAFWLPHVLLQSANIWHASGKAMWVHVFLLFSFYFAYFWHKAGQTLAMKTWKLRLIDSRTRQNPHFVKALLRSFLFWVSLLSVIGFCWFLIDSKRRTFHDIYCATEMIFEPSHPRST